MVAVVALAGILIRWPHLTESLWFDEVWRTDVVLRNGQLGRLLWHDVHNPLYNAMMYAWTGVFGDSELSVRIPSLVLGVGVIVALARWVRVRFGAAPAALAATLLAVSPVHAWYSCEAKNNMLVMFLAVLLVIRVDALTRRWRRRDALATSVIGSLAVYTSWQSLLVVLPVMVYVVVSAAGRARGADPEQAVSTRVRWRTALAVLLGTLILCAPLLVFKASHLGELERAYVATATLGRMLRFVFVWLPTGNALVRIHEGWWGLWAGVFGLAVLPALWLGWRGAWSARSGRLAVWCLAFPVISLPATTHLLGLIGREAPRVYQERNLLVVLPWFVAVLAVGACRSRSAAVPLGAVLVGLSLASSIAAVTWRSHTTTVMNPNPDWRAAAEFMRESAERAGTPAVVLSHCPLLPMAYYGPEMRLIELPWSPDVAAQVMSYHEHYPDATIYFINNPMWNGMPSSALPEFERRLGYSQRLDVKSLNIYRMTPADVPDAQRTVSRG